jgi:uncharacterized phosphosugar-binding protein
MASKVDVDVQSYGGIAIPHLIGLLERNAAVMNRVATRLVNDVRAGRSLLVFGSGHSSIFPMELYHRAGGASFVLPVISDHLLPTAGPPVVRVMERTPGAANALFNRVRPQAGEMLWLCSQSGINSAAIDLALEAKRRKLRTVAFTSVLHSSAVKSRHASGKRLFEVCDEVVDLHGSVGDASIQVKKGVATGPLSSLGAILMGNSIITAAVTVLEREGTRCVYTSVNTPEGEARNRKLEEHAMERDVLLR